MGVHKRSYLTSQQIKAIELMCTTELSRQQIADQVGCARSTLYEWLSDEKFKEELVKLSDRLIVDMRVDCIRRVKELMAQDEDKRTAFASAKFLCELNGLNATTKIDVNTTENIVVTLDTTVDNDIEDE